MRLPRPRLPGEHGLAALFFAAIPLVMFHAALFGDGVLSTANSLYAVAPLKALAPDNWLSTSNQLLSDSPTYYQPMLQLVREAMRGGPLPLWNPLISSGVPLLANQQSAPLALVNLPIWILPLQFGFFVSAALKLWLAGFGTYLLARRLAIGHWAALAAGTAFALGSFTIVWLSHGQTDVSVLLPWVLLTTEEIARRPRPAAFLGHAIATAAFLLGGHPETAIYVGLGTGLYFVVRVIAGGYRSRDASRRVAAFAGASLLGAGVAAIVLLPFIAELSSSIDSTARLRGQVAPRESLLTILFPDWWGRPNEGSALGPANFNERTFYAGTIMLVLAPLALLRMPRLKQLAPITVIGLLGLLGSTDATRTSKLLGDLPGLRLTVVSRVSVLLLLAVAVLGAAGLEELVRATRTRSRLPLVTFGAALAVGVLALVILAPLDGHVWTRALRELVGLPGFTPEKPLTSPFTDEGGSALKVLHLAAALRWIGLVLLLGGLLLLARRFPSRGRLLAPALVGLVLLDMAIFADDYQPVIPKSQFYKPVPGSIHYLQRHVGSRRFVATRGTLPPDVNMVYDLPDARGLDHPTPKRLFKLWRAKLNSQQKPLDAKGVEDVNPGNAAVVSMMAVRYVMTDPSDPRPTAPGVREVYSGSDARIWENPRALPRAYATSAVRMVPGEAGSFQAVTAADFSPRRFAVVEGRTAPAGVNARPAKRRPVSPGPVTIRRDEPQAIDLEADLRRPAVVVMADSWAPGWEPTVDGRSVPSLRANYLYRGVRVPAGRHRIEWRYRPAAVTAGGVVSALSLLALVALAVALLRRRLRDRPPGARAPLAA
jgi:hypothetical protein